MQLTHCVLCVSVCVCRVWAFGDAMRRMLRRVVSTVVTRRAMGAAPHGASSDAHAAHAADAGHHHEHHVDAAAEYAARTAQQRLFGRTVRLLAASCVVAAL